MIYKYSEEEIKRIGGSNLTRGESVNRFNAKHIPELIKYAEAELAKVKKSKKQTTIDAAQEHLDQLKEKKRAYSLAFPDTRLTQG